MTSPQIAAVVAGSALFYLITVGAVARGVYGWGDATPWQHPAPLVWPIILPMKLGEWLCRSRVKLPKAEVVKKKQDPYYGP